MKQYSFPVATHSYFRVINQAEERQRFLADDSYTPHFLYSKQFEIPKIKKRLAQTVGDEYVQRSLATVLAGAELQDDDRQLASFRQLNETLFGAPQRVYIDAILYRAHLALRPETEEYWRYIIQKLHRDSIEPVAVGPSHATFLRYKQYFDVYSHHSLHDVDQPLPALLGKALEDTGLIARGWSVRTTNDYAHAHVLHEEKKIRVGAQYQPRTVKAAARIVAHEVYGHALRGPQSSIAEAEGVALMFEQLLHTKYTLRRSYRYLAAGLGWGVEGRAMNFREVFEIVWRVMVILSRYTPEVAQRHAFDECVRVFRGGRPDIAGAVYLKDSVYFTANISVWSKLSAHALSYNDFIDLIEGRRKALI